MSTATEDKTETIPDWAAGYALTLPCEKKTPPCDREADWFANQHDCKRAYVCDVHMQECYREVNQMIAKDGCVQCFRCRQRFRAFSPFIKAVRI